jgi:3-hydroxybutyryl-CoA dehydrogenase
MSAGSGGIRVVGVVGAGTMGAGIAQVALEAGHEVVLHDVDEAAIERGRARVADGLGRRAAKAGLEPTVAADRVSRQLERLRDAHSLDAVGAEADLVIEAALEDLALKQTIFRALDAAARPSAILATNTSALSVAAIASATNRPQRVVGLHFFNPAPVMPLVEVVATERADEAVVARATAIVEAWGKTAVRVRDSPGFVVNRVNRPFTLEALRIVDQGRAGIVAVDEAIRSAGFPLGPFAYMDLVGLDVNLAAATGVWEGLGRPARLRPSATQQGLVDAGHLGRKSGRGFYLYEGGRATQPAPEFEPNARLSDLAPTEIVERIRLALAAEARLTLDGGVATRTDIDRALRLGANHPTGPLEWAAAEVARRESVR